MQAIEVAAAAERAKVLRRRKRSSTQKSTDHVGGSCPVDRKPGCFRYASLPFLTNARGGIPSDRRNMVENALELS
jgi:hypothetical protein